MSKVLAVFGATGKQGGSVINFVLNDPELSQQYTVRAITRDIDSDASKQLKTSNVQVVYGDALDRASIEAALSGVHTVFVMNPPAFGPQAFETEYAMCKTIADISVSQGIEFLIFSTLPSIRDLSSGKYTKVTPFDAKAAAETYIRSLPIKAAFYAPGYFMENFHTQPFLAPRREAASDSWVLARPEPVHTRIPYLDAEADTGKFIGAILAAPEAFLGKRICAAQGMYSFEEIVALLSRVSGKRVVYKQVPVEEFAASLPFDADVADIFVDIACAQAEFGYFGPGGDEFVQWGAEQARGKLGSLEEYFKTHPYQLE